MKRIAGLQERLSKIKNDPTEYSDPRIVAQLPFPSTNIIPSRFSINGHTFSYMGREKFAQIWNTWLEVKDDHQRRRAIYVYGTRGYGKSHMLAALACLLIRQGERVIYLPDCFAMLRDPLEYLRVAVLFAIRDASSREQIYGCETVDALASFCVRYKTSRLCFIVDQLNALDPDPHGRDVSTDTAKSALLSILQRISDPHVYITSASANHQSARYLKKKETGERKIALLGGMTTVRDLFCVAMFNL
jgi:energy-coupling factor transporter ATP-binding protein EcfA2